MATAFRKSPPVCLGVSFARLIFGKLRCSTQHLESTVKMEDGQVYTIFRHITAYPVRNIQQVSMFIVRFKFARLSHQANKIASIIPMLLITGYPGFHTKIYGVNKVNGYWQGMYQWESKQALEEYKKSFVFRIMNKRAIESTLSSFELNKQQLLSYLEILKP